MPEVALADDYEAAKKAVFAGLRAYNTSVIGENTPIPIAVAIGEGEGFKGGAAGVVWGGWLFVEALWLDESLRGQDAGTAVMDLLEARAREAGATHAYVDTFSFQARPFYEKRGYRLFGELPGFPKGHSRFWLTTAL